MSEDFQDAMLLAMFLSRLRAESEPLRALYTASPGALGEPVLPQAAYLTQAEVAHGLAEELNAQRQANLPLNPRDAATPVRPWLQRRQCRRRNESK